MPSLLRALLDSGREIGLELPRLERWFTSGEVLTPALADRFGEFLPGRELVNLYGSSEVAGDVTAGTVTPGSGWVTIGRAIANTRIHILDDRGVPVPVGVPGRIFAAGANVARGYHRRPALTAASFVPDPFSRRPGARMYDTGDRGRWRRDGTIEFLGRRDHQVKVRGVRVELGHVERALLDHPGVSQAAVLWTDAAADGGRLVVFVRSDADVADVRAHARRHLAEQMVPTTFVLVESLPLTSSGKIDRSALASLGAPAVSDRGTWRRRPRRSSRWPRCGPSCSMSSASVSRTTSSTSAATRCWQRGSSHSCGDDSASRCRSRWSSSDPSWARWQRGSRS